MDKRIVVPLDSSPLAEQALPAAEEMARLKHLPIMLIQVIDLNRFDHFGLGSLVGSDHLADQLAVAERSAKNYLEQIASGLNVGDLPTSIAIRCGDPAIELINATETGDLIVMATHGRGGLSRTLLGSVAETVARRSSVPILLVRAMALETPTEASDIERLLHQDQYRPGELAKVLSVDEAYLRQEALTGKLSAQILDHHVVSISRTDALNWLRARGGLS